MSVNEIMTPLADQVRRLSGAEGKLGIEAMTEKLAGVEVGGGSEKFKQLAGGNLIELTSEDLEGVTVLRDRAFTHNRSLQSVKIADTDIKIIPTYCFDQCENIEELELPKGLTSWAAFAFGDVVPNYKLKKLVIPKTMKSASTASFNGFKALKTIEFEEGSVFNDLGNYSFTGMDSLTHIKFPNALIWANYNFFYNCPSLQYIDFTSVEKVSSLNNGGENIFGGTTPDTMKIIVPSTLYDKWIVTTNWANFTDHIVPDTIDGTWVFNDTITWERNVDCDVNFNFIAAPNTNHINMKYNSESRELKYYLGNSGVATPYSGGAWAADGYKTINFGDTPQTCNAEFLAFMYNNATKQ